MPTPIAIAVVEHEGQFLIGQRPEGVPLAGLWEFPGGKIGPGESPEAAAIRECREEAGLEVESLFRYPEHVQRYDHDHVRLIFIACRPARGAAIEPRVPYQWVRREDLANHDFPTGNRALLNSLSTV
jgi:8-oxo-dGTP diphosphatase